MEFLFILAIGTFEFLLFYSKDLPPGFSFSFLPRAYAIEQDMSRYTDAFSENNISFLLSPFIILMPTSFMSSFTIYYTYIIGFISMFYFIKYFSTKYMSVKNMNLLRLVAILIASLYVNTFYYAGGTDFNYSLYYSLVPFILISLDKYFNTYKESKLTLLKQALIVGLVLGISTLDIRTLVFNIFIFIYFLIFIIIYEHNFLKFKRAIFMAFLVCVFYILINIKFVLTIFMESSVGNNILASIVPAQIYIALQRYNILYALAGAPTWYTTYNPYYVFLGLIPIFIGTTLILKHSMKKISAFLYIPILILLLYSSYAGNTILYYIAQTKYYPYLTIAYPDYVMQSLYDPFLYALFGLAAFNIVNELYTYLSNHNHILGKTRKKKVSKIINTLIIILIIALIIVPVEYYLQPEERSSSSSLATVNMPQYVKNVTGLIYSNYSGNVLLYGDVAGQNTYFTNMPNIIDGNYPAAPMDAFQYILSTQTKNLGNVLSYFGIQYMIYIYTGNHSMINYLKNQSTMKVVTQQHNVYLFKNLYYKPNIEFTNTLYVGFNMPYIVKYLNEENHMLPIIPFYSIKNLSQMNKDITGMVGINISAKTILPLFLNNSNSYTINTGAMNINNYPNGWGIAPDNGVGSDVNAIYPYSSLPLKLNVNIPNGKYYVVVEGGSFGYGYHTSSASLGLISGNSNASVYFNQTQYSPYVQYSSYSKIDIIGNQIYLKPVHNTPFVANIYLIPIDKFNVMIQTANNFLSTHKILNVNLTTGTVEHGTNATNKTAGNFTTLLTFTDELSPSGSLFNTLDVKNSFYHFTYNYGLGEGYITLKKPDVINENTSISSLLYISAFIDTGLLSLLYILRKYKR